MPCNTALITLSPHFPESTNFRAAIRTDLKHTLLLTYNRRLQAIKVLPVFKKDGRHYEINIPGFERFWMRWGMQDKYEVSSPADAHQLPDDLLLHISDLLEEHFGRNI